MESHGKATSVAALYTNFCGGHVRLVQLRLRLTLKLGSFDYAMVGAVQCDENDDNLVSHLLGCIRVHNCLS